jgi:hypothetical protein
MTIVKEKEIEKACSILFGDSFTFDKETIEYLQLSGIKHAFRSKVKECHPDTAANDKNSTDSNNFLKLKDAYDFLISVKSNNHITVKNPEKNYYPNSSPARKIPNRRLKLGEYLYYSEKISWDELISALTWQRQNKKTSSRPRLFGSYFIEFKIMNSTEMGFAIFKLNVHNANFKETL